MNTGEVAKVREMVAKVFPKSKWTADEWSVFTEQMRPIDLDLDQANAVVRNHRAERDSYSPSMKGLVDGMRRARSQRLAASPARREEPAWKRDNRTPEELKADREVMASRIRASMATLSDDDWTRLRERRRTVRSGVVSDIPLAATLERYGGTRITREKWAKTSENEVRNSWVLLAWGDIMRAKYGDEWVRVVWDMRDKQ